MASYREVEMLLQIGEYQQGNNPLADEAIAKHDAIDTFLSQGIDDFAALDDTQDGLFALAGTSR
jgi:type III secretion protein N (ATPase)